MKYEKRFDGRKFDEMRPIEAKVGVVKNAAGSAMFKIGKTVAIAAVYGPADLFPKFLQYPDKGRLRCHYNMMAFSGSGDRVRPGTSRRSKEISMVTEKALLPALDLRDYPKAVVDVYIELVQTDAGTRCGTAAKALAPAAVLRKRRREKGSLSGMVVSLMSNSRQVVLASWAGRAGAGENDSSLRGA